MKVKRIKENEYIEIGGNVFQYLIVDGKHKLVPTKKVIKPNKEFTPPTEQEVINYFTTNGYSEDSARKFYNYYNPEWKDSNNKPVVNWQQKSRGVWFKEENKIVKPILNHQAEGIKFFQ